MLDSSGVHVKEMPYLKESSFISNPLVQLIDGANFTTCHLVSLQEVTSSSLG